MRTKLTVLLIVCGLAVQAQTLREYNERRLRTTQHGMLVLGSWAALNLISSPILASNSTGRERYFHEMNGYWNTVNLALAGFGYMSARRADPADFSLSETLKEQHKMEKILLFNAGLDIAYVTSGFLLQEHSRRLEGTRVDQFKGFGQSLVMQGAWLFAFDLGFYLVLNSKGKWLYNQQGLSMIPGGIRYRF